MTSSMLWRFFGTPSDHLTSAEENSVNRLAEASRHAAGLDIKSAAGVDSCAAYLVAVEATARQLQIPPAPRTYRASFPLNYRSLFPSEARSYRADVLEASLEHYNVIWVNGEKFEFTAEATRRAEELQVAWIDLGAVLERWSRSRNSDGRDHTPRSARPTRAELTPVLKALDSAWASFEERYISELVEIEAKARSHIVQAIEREQRLQQLESQHGEDAWEIQEYREVQRSLVAAIARLNSVANVNRKGRDDLRVEALLEAHSTLRQCNAIGSSSRDSNILSAAKVLAADVMDSFNAMRQYLCKVANCLERVDPHLGNNSGLVARLVDWEESWEVGTAYLQQKLALHALCDAVDEIHRLQVVAPKLLDMCVEFDVELFMVLPRIMWLRFLAEPQKQIPLMARLLPHHFSAAASTTPNLGPQLRLFCEKYASVEQSLARMWEPFGTSGPGVGRTADARKLLAMRVIMGSDDHAIFVGVPPVHVDEAKAQVEGLLHELEAWSMELQRHCPEDWNQYSAVLVHCLRTDVEKERAGPFGV